MGADGTLAHSRATGDEEQALLDTYMAALGMIADLPLGRAALEREGLT